MPAIRTDDLSRRFGDTTAVDGLSLTVDESELYGFIGPNGAGKTTTVNMLTGQLKPSGGSASVLGIDPAAEPVRVRERVGILPEREDPPSFLTPREYFDFVADVRGIDDVADRVAAWTERLSFAGKLDTLNADLSEGEKQKVMITQAFLHEPALVFIDEPLINLDPLMQDRFERFLESYHADGNTVFLSTHVMPLAEDLCTRVGILDRGRLITELDMDGMDRSLSEAFISEVEHHGPAGADG